MEKTPKFEMRFFDAERNEITVVVNIKTNSVEIKTARDHIVIACSDLDLMTEFVKAVRKITPTIEEVSEN